MKGDFLKKLTLIAVTFSLVASLVFSPLFGSSQSARAGLPDAGTITISAALCLLSPTLEGFMSDAAKKLSEAINKLFDIDLGDLLGGIFGGNVPVHVKADNPFSEEQIKKCLTTQVKRAFIRAAVNDVMNFIRGDGLPRYITNYQDFLAESADRAGAKIVSDLLNRNICTPFRASVEILVQRAAFPRQLFDQRIGCTLTDAVDRQAEVLDRFVNDFRDGGWRQWIRLHESQNTLLGAYLIAEGERQRIFDLETEGAKTQAQAAQGFKDVTRCIEVVFYYPGYSYIGLIPSPPEQLDTPTEVGSLEWQRIVSEAGAQEAICTKEETITPGKTVAGAADKSISAQLDNLINSEDWQGIVQEVMTALIADILKNGFPDI